ncbi:MAG: MFS transporter [Pedosphaera sp.]|nr:MFS transporter [Pedosphaera sp.]
MADPLRTQITYRYERLRAVSAGVLEAAATTFLLLIAVRGYEAGALDKALVAGGGSFGLLLTPLVVFFVTTRGWPAAVAASRLLYVGAGSFFFAALVPGRPVFVTASVLGMASAASVIPLLTHLYQENYPAAMRGRLFSRTLMIRIAAAALFSGLAGHVLSLHFELFRCLPLVFALHFELFRCLPLVFALALVWAGYCLAHCPSHPLDRGGAGAHPLHALRFVREDRLFRRTLICWMLMGFPNLAMLSLRVEYLANPKYKLELTVGMVAVLTGVVPNLARFVLSPVWGWLFDRMNFFVLRVTLNLSFAIGILTFFVSDSLTGLVLGAVIQGISVAGGDVAWSLWVTKFAPSGRVADYMSVHTFFTGVRGVLAPLATFYCVARFAPGQMAAVSSALIVVATLMLLPEIKYGRRARPGRALVEEVSE